MTYTRGLIPSGAIAAGLAVLLAACGSGGGSNGPGPGTGGAHGGGSGGSGMTGGQAGSSTGAGGAAGATTSGAGGQGGSISTTGAGGGGGQAGGASGGGGQAGKPATDGGGQGGAAPSDGGAPSSCKGNPWPTHDPSTPGPFTVMTQTNIGPAAGAPDPKYNNTVPHFNLYRPTDLTTGGYCHPVIVWANGHGDQPSTYEVLLKQLASHGFVVAASLSSIASEGTPLPQIAGIDWMIQQNDDPTSALYHHLDTDHIGLTGHSQGAMATTMAAADPRVKAIAPIAGAVATLTVHGPAALLCGGMDTTVPCTTVEKAFNAVNDMPVMLGENLAATHGSWIGSIKDPYMIAATGWFRYHLMGDTALKSMFYGASCMLCSDAQHWVIKRKMMDQ